MLKLVMPSGRAAQLAVEIGFARLERRHGLGDRRIFMRPVECCTRQQFHRAAVEARVHAIAVVFDFVEPLVAFGRRVDQVRQLRPNPFRQCSRVGAPAARYAVRHGGAWKS